MISFIKIAKLSFIFLFFGTLFHKKNVCGTYCLFENEFFLRGHAIREKDSIYQILSFYRNTTVDWSTESLHKERKHRGYTAFNKFSSDELNVFGINKVSEK